MVKAIRNLFKNCGCKIKNSSDNFRNKTSFRVDERIIVSAIELLRILSKISKMKEAKQSYQI